MPPDVPPTLVTSPSVVSLRTGRRGAAGSPRKWPEQVPSLARVPVGHLGARVERWARCRRAARHIGLLDCSIASAQYSTAQSGRRQRLVREAAGNCWRSLAAADQVREWRSHRLRLAHRVRPMQCGPYAHRMNRAICKMVTIKRPSKSEAPLTWCSFAGRLWKWNKN